MSIYVGNLSFEVTKDELAEVFGDYGTVRRVTLPTNRETGQARGFAFVDMSTETEEEQAINTLNNATWMGRTMKVNKARPREPRN